MNLKFADRQVAEVRTGMMKNLTRPPCGTGELFNHFPPSAFWTTYTLFSTTVLNAGDHTI